jgi:putative NADH-flavin reductase
MKLTIIAATGGIGSQLLSQAVAAGHDVTAVVRNPRRVPDLPPVRVVEHDFGAVDPAALAAAIGGADAVLSGLGARSAAEAGVASRGTRALIQAMQETKVRRIVVVSAASVGTVPSPGRPDPPRHNPGDGFFMRHLAGPLAKAAFRAHYVDLALMEDDIRESGLDWTIVRPPRLLNGPRRRAYRTAYEQNVRAGMFIARADVADHMLDVLDHPETVHRITGIAY